jgi:hypothetical protein
VDTATLCPSKGLSSRNDTSLLARLTFTLSSPHKQKAWREARGDHLLDIFPTLSLSTTNIDTTTATGNFDFDCASMYIDLVLRGPEPTMTINTHVQSFAVPEMRQFTNLPVEIKEKIYKYTMHMDGQFDMTIYAAPAKNTSFIDFRFPRVHATCRTNKLERAIATLVMLRNSTVCLCRGTDAINMMNWIKEATGDAKQGLLAIKRVELICMSKYHINKAAEDISSLEACLNLRKVEFVFSLRKLSKCSRDQLSSTADVFLDKFGLLKLAACRELIHVTIEIQWDEEDYLGYKAHPKQCHAMLKAIQVIKSTFAAVNNRELNLDLTLSKEDYDIEYEEDQGFVGYDFDERRSNLIVTDWDDEDYEDDGDDDDEEDEAEESDSDKNEDDEEFSDEGSENETDEESDEDGEEGEDDGEEGEDDGEEGEDDGDEDDEDDE